MRFENTQEVVAYLDVHAWGKRDIERGRRLMERLGNPQKGMKFVHVAGTNGKGSTCAMTSSVLRAAGYRTGLYTSPHIEAFRERIQLDGEMISEEELTKIMERVADTADAMDPHPSMSEMVLAAAMLYYQKTAPDIIVLEVGMGGTSDGTNVIDAPEVAVICNIGLDHTKFLGDTVEQIAVHKCGIIKPGSAVACYANTEPVMEIIRSTAGKNGCTLYSGQDETLLYPLGLKGVFQKRNACTVLAIVHALRDRGWKISDDAIKEGLLHAAWPARYEILSTDPLFILDGGHNVQCAEALAETLAEEFGDEKVTFLISTLKTKHIDKILQVLRPHAAEFICLAPNDPRALEAEACAELIRSYGLKAVSASSVADGIERAAASGRAVVAFGSLYTAGDIRTFLRGQGGVR